MFPVRGTHITRDMCFQVGEHISQGIRFPQVGEHISLGIYVSQVGEHRSLGIWVKKLRGEGGKRLAIFSPFAKQRACSQATLIHPKTLC